jgi:AcrR family transcriptional regulator
MSRTLTAPPGRAAGAASHEHSARIGGPVADPAPGASQPGTSTRRQRARRGDGQLLHDDLIRAGCQVLAECGDSQRLSLRAVAATAGVTPAAVYRHFPDRRALVAAIVASCFADFADTLNNAAAGASDPFEGLRRRCYAYLAYGRAHPQLYRVLFGTWSTGPKAVGTYGRSPHPGATAFTDLVNAIERCHRAGAPTRRSSQFLAFHLWSTLHGIVDLRTGKPELPWPDDRDLADTALFGLALTPPRTPPARPSAPDV